MEQTFLDALKGLEGEVKGTNVSSGLSYEFGGEVKIERGNFSMNFNFYAKIYETKHKGVISIDDWDVHDSHSYNLNGLEIDNISTFRARVVDWGLKTDKLQFSAQEEKQAIAMAMLQSDEVKRVFGKKVKIWNLLSVDEQKLLDLQYVVDRYKDCGEHLKNEVARHYKIGEQPQTIPTLEQYQEKLAELIN